MAENTQNSNGDYVLTEEMVKPLKCSFCNLYLSFSPVYMATHEEVRYKCGRCSIKTRYSFRATMYENLAKYMKFPCIYKDCKEVLCWEDVREHERMCDYRTFKCFATDCQELVPEKKVALHYKEKHKKLYHFDKISIDSLHLNHGFCILEKDDQTYLLLYDTDVDKLRLSLTCISPSEKLEKQFEVKFTGKDHKSILMTEQNLMQFNDRVHCYKCLKGDCKYQYHMYHDYRKGVLKYTNCKIDKDILKRTFNNEMGCTINVVDEKKVETEDALVDLLGGKDMVVDEVNEEEEEDEVSKSIEPIKTDAIKEILKCTVCQEYLKVAIFQCLAGHAVCKDCKSKSDQCTSCEGKIENTRNYIVEEVVSNLKLFDEAKVESEDKEIMCPMSKCKDTIKISAISTHFKESHIENFHFNKVTLNNVYGYYNVDVLVKDNKTYLLFFDFNDFYFGISVCSVEAPEQLFEAKLLSDNKRYALIATDQKVIKFNDKEHCFKCSIGVCKITDHTFRVKRKEIFRRLTTKFNRDCIKRAFKSSSLSYQINIIENKENKSDRILKQLFECPICKDYMVPPIHQCIAGHTLCNVCKTKVEKCPSCEGSIQETRNFMLENISEVVELPCNFENDKCDFRGGVKRMATHELECPLNNKKMRSDEEEKEKPQEEKEKPQEEEEENPPTETTATDNDKSAPVDEQQEAAA